MNPLPTNWSAEHGSMALRAVVWHGRKALRWGRPIDSGPTTLAYEGPGDRGMTMSKQLSRAATDRDPHGWRAGVVRVVANALLVLVAYAVVSTGAVAAQMILTGWLPPATPIEGMPVQGMPFVLFAAVFILVRWLTVLPAMLPVLVGIEYIARRAPHARVLTLIIALAPMVLWETLVEGPHDFPSATAVLLGATAVLFAVIARLPARLSGRSAEDGGAAPPLVEPAVAPR
jgi:hypothetical protein